MKLKIKTILTPSFFLLIFLGMISLSFNNFLQKDDSKIYWSKDKKVTWNDFKGKPIKSSSDAAITDSGFELQSSNKGQEHILVFELHTYFIKNKSWVKPDEKTENLLKHEQGHFDISEIFTRKIHKSIMEEKFTVKNFNKKLQELNVRNTKETSKYQELYDKETEHSKNEKKQTDWNEKIAKELKDLEQYSESRFEVEVK